jgi:phage-related baseplate assembly protein
MATTTQKSFQPKSKEVRYLNKDFSAFHENLINFAKYYYPSTYADFSDASPGMMFIDMASYVGDVLSYYTDYAFKEGLLYNTTERKNIIALAKYLGYTTSPSKGATGTVDVFQICPSTTDANGSYVPDNSYTLNIQENMQVSNNVGSSFLTSAPIDFSVNTSLSPLSSSVYQRDDAGVPTYFLLQKTANIRSGKVIQKTFTVSEMTPFLNLYLDENNVLEIISVVDADNNKWYQVDFLAQEMVLADVPNNDVTEGILSQYKTTVPYILNYLKTSRRFTVNVDQNNLTFLEFGSGTSGFADEIINLSSQQVGVGLSNINNLNISLDPSNFLQNDTYGLAPSNTTLTVTYTVGGGYESNSPSNSIINIDAVSINNTTDALTPEESSLLNTVKTSLRVNNSDATVGGSGPESDNNVRQNAIAAFAAQDRIVTQDDYLARVYALPAKYGSVAKVQVITYNSLDVNQNQILTGTVNSDNTATVNNANTQNYFRKIAFDRSNPFAVNLYVLSFDENKNLTTPNEALVTNMLTYLRKYRMLTDSINIIDGYVINIGVQFAITVFKGYNKKDILANAIEAVQNFFDIDTWEFSQAINLSSLRLEIAKVEGVQTVTTLDIKNLTPLTTNGGNYSPVEYDIDAATQNDMIYPSLDPSIFEVKFPNSDIRATCL